MVTRDDRRGPGPDGRRARVPRQVRRRILVPADAGPAVDEVEDAAPADVTVAGPVAGDAPGRGGRDGGDEVAARDGIRTRKQAGTRNQVGGGDRAAAGIQVGAGDRTPAGVQVSGGDRAGAGDEGAGDRIRTRDRAGGGDQVGGGDVGGAGDGDPPAGPRPRPYRRPRPPVPRPRAGGDRPAPARRAVARPAPARPARMSGRWRAAVAALAVLLAAGLVTAGMLGRRWYDQAQLAGATAGAVAAARQTTVNFVSISAGTVDRDLQRIEDGATGEFKDEFGTDRAQVRSAVLDNKVNSTGTVLRAAVVSAGTRTVVVLLAVDATVKNSSAPDGRLSHYRIQVSMARDARSGRWLVSQLQFVG